MSKASSEDVAETEVNADPLKAVGHHVVQGKTFCGTFATAEDAQAFIDQQVAPQGLDAKVVSVEA